MTISLSLLRTEFPTTQLAVEGPPDIRTQFQDEIVNGIFRQASAGELQQHEPRIWNLLLAVEERLSGVENPAITKTLQESLTTLRPFANDSSNPSAADADLLCKVIENLLNPDRQTVKSHLAALAISLLKLGDETAILKNPESREFNSILPGLAAVSYDCGSIGRTLLFEGASHWIGLPNSDDAQMDISERCERLRNTMFGIPKTPADGNARLTNMWEFDMALDQLAANGRPTYEL